MPLPSPERAGSEDNQVLSSPVSLLIDSGEEGVQNQEPRGYFNKLAKRLGGSYEGPGGSLRLSGGEGGSSDSVEPKLRAGGRSSPRIQGGAAQPELQSDQPRHDGSLDEIRLSTSCLSSTYNIDFLNFKKSVHGKLADLERGLLEAEAKAQRAYETCRAVEQKLNFRNGQECDVIKRLDSMTGFTYAFCKGCEDAGVFKLRKSAGEF